MFTFNETDKAVQEFLNAIGVKYAFHYIGAAVSRDGGKDWEHDLFTVSFVAAGKEPMTTEYKTGIGHRLNHRTTKGGALNIMRFYAVTGRHLGAHREALGLASDASIYFPIAAKQAYNGHNPLPVQQYAPAPKAAGVLYSLLSDMSCGADTFEDFCANLGYDEDSRKAHDIYLACQKSGTQLRKVFTREQLEQLQELLQDY
jgi:hypothetical protein